MSRKRSRYRIARGSGNRGNRQTIPLPQLLEGKGEGGCHKLGRLELRWPVTVHEGVETWLPALCIWQLTWKEGIILFGMLTC